MSAMKTILITGSSGLIGSEVSTFFHEHGFFVHGLDNNQRAVFSGHRATPGGTSTGSKAASAISVITSSISVTVRVCLIWSVRSSQT